MDFCTYLITYTGDKVPPKYLGSTSKARLAKGYLGSVSSLQFKEAWKLETRAHPELFSVQILTEHSTRKEALRHEREMGEALDVVRDPRFANKSLACPNGFFGMDVSGENHPLFGVGHTPETIKKLRASWTPERKAAQTARLVGHAVYSPICGKYTRTAETRKLISERRMGMELSTSHREAIGKGLRKLHAENPEIREQMSISRKGRKRPDAAVRATAAAHCGMKRSEETRAKIKAAWVKRKEREAVQ